MMAGKVKKRSASCWKDPYIQIAIVLMFFISIFANIGIILHSHVKERNLNAALPVPALNWDNEHKLSSALAQIGSGPRSFLGPLVTCIQRRGNQAENETLPWSSLSDFKDHFQPPAFVGDDILLSINHTLHYEYVQQADVVKTLSKSVINHHAFHYIHNPLQACTTRKIDVVLAVVSPPENFDNRLLTRQGLKGSYAFEKSNNATLIFFVGKSNHHNKSRKYQVHVNMEMRRFGDIVQEDFVDEYRNMTLKTISVLKWVTTYCSGAQFVIKSDDDMGIKTAQAIEALQRNRERFGNFILGQWSTARFVQRSLRAKNYVSKKEYPNATFPPHLVSGAMGFPVTTVKLLYQVTQRVNYFWIDHIYLTGMCAPLVNIPLLTDVGFDLKHKEW